MKNNVHRVVCTVIDQELYEQGNVVEMIERNKHISVTVDKIDTVQVDWTDDHPLNNSATRQEELDRLFPPK